MNGGCPIDSLANIDRDLPAGAAAAQLTFGAALEALNQQALNSASSSP